jgi:hypothetical protein
MSFTGLKHIYLSYSLDTYGTFPIPKRKCTSHSMTDLPKSYRMGLEKLNQHSAKATFLHWKKYRIHPLFWKINRKKHSVGNHTFDHLNGWKTTNNDYNANISLCENSIKNNTNGISSLDSKFFALHMVK